MNGDPYRNVEEAELDQIATLAQDAYVDEFGYTQKRPGLADFVDLGTNVGIDGLYWWDTQQILLVVSAGRIWKITDATGTKTELTSDLLSSGTRVTFAANGTTMTMANGGRMVTTSKAGPTTYMADADAPTAVSHVGYLDGYTLALQANSQTFGWSDNLLPLLWNASSQAQAQGAPDNTVSLMVGWREILLIGNDTVEVWYDDGVAPFVRLNGGFVQWGCSAPYSVQQVNTNWMWLDQNRHFVKLDNRTPTIMSFPYNKQLQMFTSVNDAISDVMQIDGLPLYVISFPSARRTFVYNYMKDSWTDWGAWNTGTATYDRFKGQCYAFARPWNLHLVGDSGNGKLYKCSRAYYDDAGSPIRTVRRTGFVTHGITQNKFSKELQIRLKRGAGTASVADPQMFVRWRNDGGAWGNEHWVSLGQVGQHEYIARLHGLGKYRTRQWEFGHTDNSEFILMSAKELVEPATR